MKSIHGILVVTEEKQRPQNVFSIHSAVNVLLYMNKMLQKNKDRIFASWIQSKFSQMCNCLKHLFITCKVVEVQK